VTFKDHFSGHASAYASARPTYPDSLFAFLAGLAPSSRRALDCGTGNGQAALSLAAHFEEVIASDPSAEQVARSPRRNGVHFLVATAEASPVAARSVALVTVAQALHWLETDAFFREATRVLVPRGIVAVWCYNLLSIEPEIDRLVFRLYADTLGKWWAPERRLVDDEYRSIPFPFEEIEAPVHEITLDWTLSELAAYLRTWSACVRYRVTVGVDPVDAFVRDAQGVWGDEGPRRVRWPIHLRVGRVR
jgi:SAM-dependent methyltransferase